MEKDLIVVIFSTRNGSDTLQLTLDGYVGIDYPKQSWRILVVNNGSTDSSSEILENYREKLPLTIIDEPRPGKNTALNSALAAVCQDNANLAQLYIFTDDDAVPDVDFLKVWSKASNEKPEYDLFGGSVVVKFMANPPAWLSGCSDWYGELYAENKRAAGNIAAHHIFGPNMAVRAKIFRLGFRFDETIGPNGNANYAMGSETEFCVRVERDLKAKAWFLDNARVDHLVRPWQMTQKFFASRAQRHGRGVAQQHVSGGKTAHRVVLKAAWSFFSDGLRAAFLKGSDSYHFIWQANWSKGYVKGYLDKNLRH